MATWLLFWLAVTSLILFQKCQSKEFGKYTLSALRYKHTTQWDIGQIPRYGYDNGYSPFLTYPTFFQPFQRFSQTDDFELIFPIPDSISRDQQTQIRPDQHQDTPNIKTVYPVVSSTDNFNNYGQVTRPAIDADPPQVTLSAVSVPAIMTDTNRASLVPTEVFLTLKKTLKTDDHPNQHCSPEILDSPPVQIEPKANNITISDGHIDKRPEIPEQPLSPNHLTDPELHETDLTKPILTELELPEPELPERKTPIPEQDLSLPEQDLAASKLPEPQTPNVITTPELTPTNPETVSKKRPLKVFHVSTPVVLHMHNEGKKTTLKWIRPLKQYLRQRMPIKFSDDVKMTSARREKHRFLDVINPVLDDIDRGYSSSLINDDQKRDFLHCMKQHSLILDKENHKIIRTTKQKQLFLDCVMKLLNNKLEHSPEMSSKRLPKPKLPGPDSTVPPQQDIPEPQLPEQIFAKPELRESDSLKQVPELPKPQQSEPQSPNKDTASKKTTTNPVTVSKKRPLKVFHVSTPVVLHMHNEGKKTTLKWIRPLKQYLRQRMPIKFSDDVKMTSARREKHRFLDVINPVLDEIDRGYSSSLINDDQKRDFLHCMKQHSLILDKEDHKIIRTTKQKQLFLDCVMKLLNNQLEHSPEMSSNKLPKPELPKPAPDQNTLPGPELPEQGFPVGKVPEEQLDAKHPQDILQVIKNKSDVHSGIESAAEQSVDDFRNTLEEALHLSPLVVVHWEKTNQGITWKWLAPDRKDLKLGEEMFAEFDGRMKIISDTSHKRNFLQNLNSLIMKNEKKATVLENEEQIRHANQLLKLIDKARELKRKHDSKYDIIVQGDIEALRNQVAQWKTPERTLSRPSSKPDETQVYRQPDGKQTKQVLLTITKSESTNKSDVEISNDGVNYVLRDADLPDKLKSIIDFNTPQTDKNSNKLLKKIFKVNITSSSQIDDHKDFIESIKYHPKTQDKYEVTMKNYGLYSKSKHEPEVASEGGGAREEFLNQFASGWSDLDEMKSLLFGRTMKKGKKYQVKMEKFRFEGDKQGLKTSDIKANVSLGMIIKNTRKQDKGHIILDSKTGIGIADVSLKGTGLGLEVNPTAE